MPSLASRLPLTLAIGLRFLRPRGRGLVDGTARAAFLATALGVTAMVIAMALMSGYRNDLQRKLIGGNAAIVAYPLAPEAGEPSNETLAALETVDGVEAVGRIAYAQGALAGGAMPEGVEVTVRGIDPGGRVPGGGSADLSTPGDGPDRLLLGEDLAARLAVATGDRLRLVVLGFEGDRPRFRYRTVEVAGTFRSGLSEFDSEWVVADRAVVQRLSGLGAASSVLELHLEDPSESGRKIDAVREILGPDHLVSDWQDLNRELFTALRVQQIGLFLVLGLIVLVSTFNVASTLVVLVRERLREVGVLAALGFSGRRIRALFLGYGLALGTTGTLAGLVIGSTVSWVFTEFELIRFGPDVAAIYFLSSVPFQVRPMDLAAVALFSVAVTLAASWLPSGRAARVRPADALRYE